ncbi:HAD family phosphatase [Oceanispirochaeta crateris]|uniref:HAD family phosphatase n=2 Tax=Oceanispirochaeta crateris TaxID=2518645 RepID=A0A5C1QPK8_9SPIO|nr:HAD family phosphatase [Oceanispirochaeta crateris]
MLAVMKPIKLIACDMDGTLLDDQKRISTDNIEAINKLKARGIYFVIATGRHDSMVKGYLDTLGLEMPVISCNGAMVREPFSNHLFSSIPLQTEQVFEVILACKSLGADYHIYGRDVIYGETLTSRMFYYNERNKTLPERDKIKLFVSKDYRNYVKENTGELYKILIIPSSQNDFIPIKEKIFKATGLHAFQSDAALLDVAQKGITKAHAIQNLCRELKISQEETAAIGDQLNDLDMIEYAGIGIAMNNAVQPIKEAAQNITKKNNNQSGVAEAIHMLLALK